MGATGGTRGRQYEELAIRWLCARGLQLLASNYRSRCGEIDLVMRQQDQIVFVEVKYRSCSRFGGALEQVSRRQQLRIMRTAQQYLAQQRLDLPCRFDVLGISGPEQPEFHWITNAFGN